MWALANRTPYAAGRNWIRDKQGVHQWLVAVKATFDVSPAGKVTLSDEQPAPLLEPRYRGDPASSSLCLDSDLLAVKPNTDIVLDAAAHAPNSKPAPVVPVGFRVGDVEKSLLVHGTRVYYRGALGLTTTAPKPFITQPIQYELAFGGVDVAHPNPEKHRIDARNPVGRGFAADSGALEQQLAHSIEYPNQEAKKAGPAGFGPIASFWSPRHQRSGTYDARWETSKRPLLPDDYDDRHALSSPDDQRPAHFLRGGELVAMSNLTEGGFLRFELPKVLLVFRTFFGKRAEDHRASMTTVFLEPDRAQVSLVWQTAIPVHARDVDYLDTTLITEKHYLD